MARALAVLPVLLLACAGPSRELHAGDRAPGFTLPDTEGRPVTLDGLLARGPVILAFFPRAFTGGCTRQMTALRDAIADGSARGAVVVGVSTDDVATLRSFRESLKAPFPMLSDEDGSVAAQYVGTKAGLANRANFVIDTDGRIVRVTRGSGAVDPGADVAACPVGGG